MSGTAFDLGPGGKDLPQRLQDQPGRLPATGCAARATWNFSRAISAWAVLASSAIAAMMRFEGAEIGDLRTTHKISRPA
jgi:hypothetical protein